MSKKNTVLVLNYSYEPIGTTNVENAIGLQYKEKVFVEEYQDVFYRSAKEVWQVPSVIRLRDYNKEILKKKRESFSKRKRIYVRDNFHCGYCGDKFQERELTLDHIKPKARGGKNEPENLVTCCFRCNQRKKDMLLSECGMQLRFPAKHFQVHLDKVVTKHYAELRPHWAKYLYAHEDSSGDARYSHFE